MKTSISMNVGHGGPSSSGASLTWRRWTLFRTFMFIATLDLWGSSSWPVWELFAAAVLFSCVCELTAWILHVSLPDGRTVTVTADYVPSVYTETREVAPFKMVRGWRTRKGTCRSLSDLVAQASAWSREPSWLSSKLKPTPQPRQVSDRRPR